MANLFSSAAIAALGNDVDPTTVSLRTLCRCAIHSHGIAGASIRKIKSWIDA